MLSRLMRESLSEYDLDTILAELIRIHGSDVVVSTVLLETARQIENQEILEILKREI